MPTVRRTRPWTSKPPLVTQINRGHSLAQELQGFYSLAEGGGSTIGDVSGNLSLVTTGFGSNNPWGQGLTSGLNCSMAGEGAVATLPSNLQFGWPLSIAVGMTILGTPTASTVYWGLVPNNTGAVPYTTITLLASNTATAYTLGYSSGSSFEFFTGGSIATGPAVLSATVTASLQAMYLNGATIASQSPVASNPAYTATASVALGVDPGISSRNTNALIHWCGWWNRTLTAAEHLTIGQSPNAIWQIFQPARGPWLFAPPSAAAGTSVYWSGLGSLRPTQRPPLSGQQITRLYG